MTIIYNDIPTNLPQESMSLSNLAEWKKLPSQGTAIALNDRLVKKDKWDVTILNPMDRVTVITAAFGG